MSAVNGFFMRHGLEAVVLGDLVAKVRKICRVASND
jgi:hypothetical protein